MKFHAALAGLFALACALSSAALGNDPPELTALRQQYTSLLAAAESAPRSRWISAIEAREKLRVAQGDFDGASLMRARRLALARQSGESGAPGAGAVLLSGKTAKSSFGVEFTDAKKEVGRFRRAGALMEWELPGQKPGTYQVNLVCGVMGEPDHYAAAASPTGSSPPGIVAASTVTGGGTVEFRLVSALKEGGSVLRQQVKSTGGWAMERSIPLGNIILDSKIMKFSLRAVEAMPPGLMDFRRLEMVPAASTPAGPVDPGGLKELARLQKVYQTQYAELTRTLNIKYLKALGELEAASVKLRDNDMLALVRQEKERMGTPESGAGGAGSSAGGKAVRLLPVTERLYMLLRGEAKLTNQGDYLTRMRPAQGCEVTWKLSGLGVTSGTYQVEVDCRLNQGNGGTGLLVATAPGGTKGPATPFSVSPEGHQGPQTPHSFPAGTVTIPKGSEYLTLRVASLAAVDGSLFDLKALRLTPVEEPAAPAPAPSR